VHLKKIKWKSWGEKGNPKGKVTSICVGEGKHEKAQQLIFVLMKRTSNQFGVPTKERKIK
jgi:hypothetical protein